MYQVGELVVYGTTGVCRVEGFGTPDPMDRSGRQYYQLKPLYQDGVIYTPVEGGKVPMRPVMSAEAARALAEEVPQIQPEEHRARTIQLLTQHYQSILQSGSSRDLLELAMSIQAKRRQAEKAEERRRMDSAQAIYEMMHPRMQDLPTEQAWVLLMNQNFKLIRAVQISNGGISETAVDVRIILKEALLSNATVIALCHNHPSNNASPSGDDDRLTQRLKKACETMRIYMLDHIIVTDGAYYSYMENGRL